MRDMEVGFAGIITMATMKSILQKEKYYFLIFVIFPYIYFLFFFYLFESKDGINLATR